MSAQRFAQTIEGTAFEALTRELMNRPPGCGTIRPLVVNHPESAMAAVSPRTVVNTPPAPLPKSAGTPVTWAAARGDALAWQIASAAAAHEAPTVLVTADTQNALRLEQTLRCFAGADLPVRVFPDWETLPYDVFSPHQDIISERLSALYHLPTATKGILLVPLATLLQRLPPRVFLERHALILAAGDRLDLEGFRLRLEAAGYQYVSQVMEHGEFAVRGALIDLFPMGTPAPLRIDLFDDEVDTIRTFDPDSQRTIEKVDRIQLLPAREFPLTREAITRFRHQFRAEFEGDPQRSTVYTAVSDGQAPPGIEYYLPLFYDETATLFDYLPERSLLIEMDGIAESAAAFREQLADRYEQRRHDRERPILAPDRLYLTGNEFGALEARFPRVKVGPAQPSGLPPLGINPRAEQPAADLEAFLSGFDGRVLFTAEGAGRRELVAETLRSHGLKATAVADWAAFLAGRDTPALTVAPLEQGFVLPEAGLAVIPETALMGARPRQQRRRSSQRDAETIVRNLNDLAVGAPVVHEDHGVGRYQGLQTLEIAGMTTEFVVMEYADGGKLYVPVASLHLLSRYTGSDPALAPLHKLGSDQWERAKRKAAEKVRDAAAELLDLYARREARGGHGFDIDDADYQAFAAAFPFEETPDQAQAIEAVMDDMRNAKAMDRVICGDVGFGKTEVAMRAAFLAVQDGQQVAVLVPTTLLAQQHYQNFIDRFADWPVRVESLSRFRSKKEQTEVLSGLAAGTVDIVIGTHKLVQGDTTFKRLGLVIIDEEHRFGVRQKERLKQLRAEVDVLTMTATPIPRTLNFALSGLRDLSVIATPPAGRLAVKTFVGEWNGPLIQEACQRELKRGGQVYFLHNEVESIERIAREIEALIPEARIGVAHGQMRERDLEQVMLDFYHQRCNILICTTIVESGIDVPNANTIIINRADRLGLAQLHQLRGRVGRSHHRAYCYLVIPHKKAMTPDAIKRIDAIVAVEDLGAGFMLANHDLEIRGAGELLGEEQTGQIQEVGFNLYMELLERAVSAIKAGRTPDLDRPLDHGPEVDLQTAALIPEDYLPDVHSRLILYKRIASAETSDELRELQVEMIDRFGLLPAPVKALFLVTELKLKATPLGVRKIEAGPNGGRLIFGPNPKIDTVKLIKLIQTPHSRFKLDGQDRLRFTESMPDAQTRAQKVEGILQGLAG